MAHLAILVLVTVPAVFATRSIYQRLVLGRRPSPALAVLTRRQAMTLIVVEVAYIGLCAAFSVWAFGHGSWVLAGATAFDVVLLTIAVADLMRELLA